LLRNHRPIEANRVRLRVAIQVAGAIRSRDSCPPPSVDDLAPEGATRAVAQRHRPADLHMALPAAPVCRRRLFHRTAPDRRAPMRVPPILAPGAASDGSGGSRGFLRFAGGLLRDWPHIGINGGVAMLKPNMRIAALRRRSHKERAGICVVALTAAHCQIALRCHAGTDFSACCIRRICSQPRYPVKLSPSKKRTGPSQKNRYSVSSSAVVAPCTMPFTSCRKSPAT
jgi:hypothetical protein